MTKSRGLLILAVLSFGATVIMNAPSNRVIKQWHQPKEISYQSYDPYTVSVLEGAIDWNNLLFPRRHYLFIGRGSDPLSYGVRVDHTFPMGTQETDAYIRRSTVEWTPDGLTFVEESGTRLFLPKARFIGGR